jgi:hypothetical protein
MFEQTQLAGQAFELGARGGCGNDQGQADMIGGATHQVEDCFDRRGIRVPEVGVNEASVAALEFASLGPLVGESGVDHAAHLGWNLVGGHADEALCTCTD